MARYFNTEGRCRPDKHYMVRLDERLKTIKEQYVDREKYFVINRGRQYGKTTTLMALAEYLRDDYIVLALDFQTMSTSNFADEPTYIIKFVGQLESLFSRDEALVRNVDADALRELCALKKEEASITALSLDILFERLSRVCETAVKPIVMMIDEVDSAANNQVFIDFLAQLRGYYLNRENRPAFHSVILAGVYDIKNLKLKLRPDEDHQYNSPWNITAKFKVDMSFSQGQIADMLREYEADHRTGMCVETAAAEIFEYTSGYPYLVSAVCKYLDEDVPAVEGFAGSAAVWTKEGVAEAVKILLKDKIPLFDSMIRQLDIYKDLRKMIEGMIYQGKRVPFSPDEKSIDIGVMFGFLREKDGQVIVSNRIFEMRLMNLFITEEALESEAFQRGDRGRNQFVKNGRLDMELVLAKFVEYFTDIYGGTDEKFVEKYGRKFFLLYLKPIINGTGNYYLEAQTRDARRTDVIVDYAGEQFIVEMKIWYGNEYNERGERQLVDYLAYFRLDKGYMLSFNFNKKKETGMRTITLGGRTIVEAVV